MSSRPSKSTLPAIAGASLAAIGASACCVLPLVLAVLGIGGAWAAHLTALDAWRPWLSGAALACLAWAFWRLYGPAVRCEEQTGCAYAPAIRRRRLWLWVGTAAIALLLLFPYYLSWFA